MKNQKAIVTIAIGKRYVECWKKYCQPNWQAYAHKYEYDLICLEHSLDLSSRAKLRSPAWQKRLILSQGFASDYKTVVWIDSDIVINDNAPDVTIGVPANKVGAVDAVNTVYQSSFFLLFCETMDQMPMVNPGAVSWWKI
jgi:hypothetical protein